MTAVPQQGVAINMFLTDGTPKGIRTIERMNWSGSLLAFSRADYANVKSRGIEIDRTGVYFIVGPDPEGPFPQRMYVGEGEVLRTRLDEHQAKKGFWTQGYLLTTIDDSLNKAHARYLEARFIALAKKARNVSLDNGNKPKTKKLSEAEEAAMEAYVEAVIPLLPVAGLSVFEEAESTSVQAPDPEAGVGNQDVAGVPRLELSQGGVQAEGEDRSKGFLVFEGARARRKTTKMAPSYEALRESLISQGFLEADGDDTLILTKSYLFDSPSAAASVLVGGSRNGRIVWKEVGSGKTLADLQAEAASNANFLQVEPAQPTLELD
jgi:hypothetical protein